MSKELIDSFAQAVRAIYKDDPSKEQAGIDAARSALETAIEALQARVAELEKVSQDDRACCVSLQKALLSEEAENDALAVELAAIKAREPVAWRWRMNGQWHYGPEPLFKDGFTTQEPLYDKPIPPVREPLSDNTIAALRQAIVQPARQVPTTNYVQPVPDHCDRITWRNRYYHLPLAAALPYGPRPTFGAIGSRDVDVAEAQRAWDKAMAAQPAQVPCAGKNCGSTNPRLHSAECFDEHESITGGQAPVGYVRKYALEHLRKPGQTVINHAPQDESDIALYAKPAAPEVK